MFQKILVYGVIAVMVVQFFNGNLLMANFAGFIAIIMLLVFLKTKLDTKFVEKEENNLVNEKLEVNKKLEKILNK